MSRRQRRQKKQSKKNHGGLWLRLLGVAMVLITIALGGSYLWLRQWLHSDEFRLMLSDQAGRAMQAEAEFGSFNWDGMTVQTKSFTATGDSTLSELRADGLSIHIGLDQIRSRIVNLNHASITQLDTVMDFRDTGDAEPEPASETTAKEEAWYDRFLPQEIILTELKIGQSSVRALIDSGTIAFSGTSWVVHPNHSSGGYDIVGKKGTLTTPWAFVPEMHLDRARIRYDSDTLFLTDSRFHLYNRGVLDLTGEASTKSDGFSFNGELYDVMANEVLPEDWKQRLTGQIESDFRVYDRGHGVTVNGSLKLRNGVLTGLPVLDALGAYGGNPRFRRLTLSEASVDYRWHDGETLLTNFKLGSEGLMHVEGKLRISPDEKLDGQFRVGLTPGTLALIPGAETDVFLAGERGLRWAPLRITGTLDDPKEDLTERLIAAAGMRMFEVLPQTGERVLKFSRRTMDEVVGGDLLGEGGVIQRGQNLLDQGKDLLNGEGDPVKTATDVIREGEDVIREFGGIFDSLRKKEKKEDER